MNPRQSDREAEARPGRGQSWLQTHFWSVHFDFTCLPQRLNELRKLHWQCLCLNRLFDGHVKGEGEGDGAEWVLPAECARIYLISLRCYGDFAIATVRDICVKCVFVPRVVWEYFQQQRQQQLLHRYTAHTHTHGRAHECKVFICAILCMR